MQKFVKRIGDERLSKVPRDLDTKPYRDEHDTPSVSACQDRATALNEPHRSGRVFCR
jgi:hypothetical protein